VAADWPALSRSGVKGVELGLGDSLLVGVEPDVAEQ
jgi:hypothetical protein